MTGVVTMNLSAKTLSDGIDLATERWRQILGDPEADLPWSTHVVVVEHEEGDGLLNITVTVEFDRTLVETATGAASN